MSGLPTGWVEVELGDVIEPKETRNPRTDGSKSFRYIDVQAVDNDRNRVNVAQETASRTAPSRARRLVRKDDVLFCLVRPYLRNIARVPPELDGQVASTAFCVLRPSGAVASRFLFHQVLRDSFIGEVPTYGTSPPSAREDEFLKQAIPLAPLPEQHRVVAKIESLFARLEEGVAALKRAEAKLERYRASVLKAAVEGRLTEQWRKENPPEETGEELLRRILAERRKRWEAEQLAKFEAKGMKPPKNWRAKYKEPVAPDTSGLPKLPEGWCWATVDQVALGMRNGRSVRTRAGGFPVLRLSAITGAVLDDRDTKEGDWGPKEAAPFRVRQGDFFVSRGNGSLDLVGRASFADDCVGEVAFPDTMIRVTFACREQVRARFVAAVWNSEFVRRQITECAKTSAGIYKINQLDLHGVLLPVPQDRITASHREFELARSHLANRVTIWCQHAFALRQSILKRAFEGRLVSQDPSDEPASVLLERIRAERAAERKRRKRRPSQRKRQPKSRVP